jgi:gamma-glutamyltranspeptidase/glutathione hydrolase
MSVVSSGGMVASSQRLASEAGVAVLRAGGSAADACIAMDAVLHVTEPPSTGLGGDMFALYFDASDTRVYALNGSGRSAHARTLDDVARDERDMIPAKHGDAVTVPGVCAGWFDLNKRFGRQPVGELLQAAIRTAESGFPVASVAAAMWDRNFEQVQGTELTLSGRAPKLGETFRNPSLGRVLRAIAAHGPSAFYRGDVAERIVAAVQAAGGAMAMDDLENHTSTWADPIAAPYRGIHVWEHPPNGQGLAALLALAILDEMDLAPWGTPERAHVQIEALRLGFADARWYVADPDFGRVPVDALLSPEYIAQRRGRIDSSRAATDVTRGSPNGIPGTVYHCAVDADGNACSFVSSVFASFGSGIVPPGLGFALQNRGCGFSLNPRHPNVFAPAKRPFHTIIPGLMTRADGSLWGPFGVMGGPMQPQGHLQVVTALIADDADPQAALDRPRFFIEPEIDGGKINLETGTSPGVAEGLRARGHELVIDPSTYGRSMFGRGQVIRRDTDGRLVAGSDKRADGCALAT